MSGSGQCLCGAVKFTAEGMDPHIHACHCTMCRGWNSGPMMGVNVASVTFEGEESIKRYASSEWAERGFCQECGSSLFYHLKEPSMYTMSMGAFDDDSQFSVHGEIYIDEKPDGYNLAGDHPRLTGAEFLASIGQPQ